MPKSKMQNNLKNIVHYSISMTELINKFPELKSPVEKITNKLLKGISKKEGFVFEKIIIAPKYTSRDSYPTILNIKFECFGEKNNANPYTYIQTFKSTWKEL